MSTNRIPVAATAARIARLTVGSRARSAGSSKYSDLRSSATTRWSGRPGMAACGEVSSVSVVIVPRTRVSNSCDVLEDMTEGVVCAWLCDGSSEKSVTKV